MVVTDLFISPGHNFFGHHGKEPSTHPIEQQCEIQCVAGLGIVGDRFYDYQANYNGQITFLEREVYLDLCSRLGVYDRSPGAFRRNVVTQGVRLNDLIGSEFVIQGIRFRGTEEARPCYWMDRAFAPGANDALKGRGGLRAIILSSGMLRKEV
ncbi:MAG: MOSC domain-containing protein [Verrucomicrobia bacterium]|nr:MOSC domain-containing protein [Verrucomicrobiota bacterium]